MSDLTAQQSTTARPGAIDARPVPHPWRWVAIVVIAILVAMMINSFVTNSNWDWSFVWNVMHYNPVLRGLLEGTIIGTILAMIIGIVLGVLLAIMRLSDNPILKAASWVYIWFFRGIPRYVLLIVMSVGILYLYPKLTLGIPFLPVTFMDIDVKSLSTGLFVGVLGLGLSEAAYMAEIARAGILSVDKGQDEAACALGMNRGKAMRRVILPQAMRVIVPPTGNETLSMVKDTSLLVAVPVSNELFFQAQAVSTATYKVMPALLAAVIWYLIVSTVLGFGQSWLEKRFGRGFGTQTGGSAKNASRLRFIGMRGGGGN